MWFLKSFNHRGRWVQWLQAQRCKFYTYFCLSRMTLEMGGICAHYPWKNSWNYTGSHEVKGPFCHYTSDMYCVPCSSCQCLEHSR